MPITGFDYVYVETHAWDEATAFWQGLGFSFAAQWGDVGHRAGRLESGTEAVVLAEAAPEQTAAFSLYFTADDITGLDLAPSVEVVTALHETHWHTKMVEVRDPEGHVYALQEGGD